MPCPGEAENEKHSERNCGSHAFNGTCLLEKTFGVGWSGLERCHMFRRVRRRIQEINAATANPIVNMTEIPYVFFSTLGAFATYGPGFRIASSASAMTR